ncbi:hypothetical protein P12x_003871 [Tundrisphaera lichenicola]|uniref:hypothetical protein n=1 Tax=Tundrisphaera lichenicola TaxID=2029860 RepID=UPI003EB9F97B
MVAFTAVGIAMVRPALESQILAFWTNYVFVSGTPLLASWTILCLVLNLRKPRPAISALFRQPGAAASLAAFPTAAIWAGILGYWWLQGDVTRAMNRISYVGTSGGASVLGAWLVLMVSGIADLDRRWINGFGLAVGWSWIALMFLILYHDFFHQ